MHKTIILINSILVLIIAATLFWSAPYFLSISFVALAGQELNVALAEQGLNPAGWDVMSVQIVSIYGNRRWSPVQLTPEEMQKLEPHRLEEATQKLHRATTYDPHNAVAYQHLGEVLFVLDKEYAAPDLNLRDRQAANYIRAGKAYLDVEDYERAEIALERASRYKKADDTRICPYMPSVFGSLVELGMPLNNLANFMVQRCGGEVVTKTIAELEGEYYYQGMIYEHEKKWNEALIAYQHALVESDSLDVGQSHVYYRMGHIYKNKIKPRELDRALEMYQKAIAAKSFSSKNEAAWCHYHTGETLRLKKANAADYISEYKMALELNPKLAAAYIQLGNTYYREYNDVEMAEAELVRATEIAPKSKWAYQALGNIYRHEGISDKAIAAYDKVLELDPQDETAKKYLTELQKQ